MKWADGVLEVRDSKCSLFGDDAKLVFKGAAPKPAVLAPLKYGTGESAFFSVGWYEVEAEAEIPVAEFMNGTCFLGAGGGAAPAASGSSGVALVRQLERQLAEALASTQGQVAQALAAVRQAEYNFDLVRIRSEFLETQAALGLGVGVLGASFGLWTLWKVAVKRAR